MAKNIKRVRNSCDGCALRRVKCDGGSPCIECKKRGLDCQRRRPTSKRGPKGPREATARRVEEALSATNSEVSSPRSPLHQHNNLTEFLCYERYAETYHQHLAVCRRDLATLWPIIDPIKVLNRLQADPDDWQAQVLAASLCAATIAQLRLDHNPEPGLVSSSHEFAKEATRLRRLHDYQNHPSLDSLLSSFFLHVYQSNSRNLHPALYLLREMVTTLQILQLHDLDSYINLSQAEYQRRLCIFWIALVTEK